MRAHLLLLCAAALIAVSAQQSQNAQPQRPKPQQKPDEKKNAGEKQDSDPGQVKDVITITNVALPVTITDKNNRFVVNLRQSDFQIIEDKAPQEIISFQPQKQSAGSTWRC